MKSYIPPKNRGRFKIKLNTFIPFVGLVMTFFIFLACLSLVSVFQSSYAQEPVTVTTMKYKPAEISDKIKATFATAAKLNSKNLTNITVTLSNLPLERFWPVSGRITTRYSFFHPAIDIANSRGTAIHPFASGIVTTARYGGGFGRYIVIRHNDGYESTYAHLNSIKISVGQQVTPNDIIGELGSSGNATGPHLHFQLSKNGKTFDPLAVLPRL